MTDHGIRVASQHPQAPIGAFFTPLPWAKWLVRQFSLVAKWADGATLCDPTAGAGVFIHALMEVATESGIEVHSEMLSRLFVMEAQRKFIRQFQTAFVKKYQRPFPASNISCADIILRNPGRKFNVLLGNPPWANFGDLPDAYKTAIRPYFLEYGLAPDRRALLLGGSRIELAALIIAVTLFENLLEHGEAFYFLPLSLFFNEGASTGFRHYVVKQTAFRVAEIWDFRKTTVFPEILTHFGVARFQRNCSASFPIPYHVEQSEGWLKRFAAPLGENTAPLSVIESDRVSEAWRAFKPIPIRSAQQPRQGVNTCGANQVFIFNDLPEGLPKKWLFPLLDRDCFRNALDRPHKYILLPYHCDTGRPLTPSELEAIPELADYLKQHQTQLCQRRGTLIQHWIKRGIWWACLGVGLYSFAPYKIVWEAYGGHQFKPVIFSSWEGLPWQGNQALHAYLPCLTLAEAETLLKQLQQSPIESYLQSMPISGTRNWLQPGRIKRFLKITEPEATNLARCHSK